MQSSLTKSKPTPYGRWSYSYVFTWAPDAVRQLRRRNGRGGGRRAGHDALSAMGDTGRLVGMGGLNTILDTMASRRINCCTERGKDGEMALASALFPARRDGPEDARVGRQACDRDADVVVNAEHFLLIRGQLTAGALEEQWGCGSGTRANERGNRPCERSYSNYVSRAWCAFTLRHGPARTVAPNMIAARPIRPLALLQLHRHTALERNGSCSWYVSKFWFGMEY